MDKVQNLIILTEDLNNALKTVISVQKRLIQFAIEYSTEKDGN